MRQLSTLVTAYKDRSLKVVQGAYVATCNATQIRTPVDQGTLRRSWTPALNRVDGSNSGGDASEVAGRMKLGDSVTFTNAQPYAARIEYEAHSMQAPNGMRDISTAEWPANVKEAIKNAS